ncbi:DNA primase [Streptomyces sp. NL15-2K]|uniref:DNA primase n=1 Tax=Streptomyces sp. NL15-2K TaxID=376149 RepID=UPI000F5815B3|nr:MULTISPECIES: DNA primase [Actinomycetes]WKX14392.1 hypothetical protein Q4V64_45540 [Kutzneria buriramensis]GCB44544.1 hypothetical protein SNL152K_1834 [Streptomyces sp. NL15-2K]
MNRAGLGLAVGAGYVLGRTKKLKLAFAVGTLVAGKRMHLSPRALADLVSGQLRNNPQFKEIGDQLREDLRGVGKAASGAMVERRIDALADRLHGRTAQVRDQLAGVVPDMSDQGSEAEERAREYDEPEEEPDEEAPAHGRKAAARTAPPPARKAAKKATAKTASAKKTPAKKTPAKKATKAAGKTSAGRAPAKKAAANKAAAKKSAAKKATAAKSAARGTRARRPRGGGER